MPEWACVNGRFSPIDDATVPINDRGLLFADSVYEVFHAHGGRLFLKAEHYRRLEASLAAIEIAASLDQIRAWVSATLEQSRLDEALVYLQVTRGVAPRGHLPPAAIEPTVIVTVRPPRPVPAEVRERGVAVITVSETRWARRDVKTTNLLANVLAKRAAEAAGAFEALFVERDGTVNEGSSTNFFAVFGETIVTPPKSAAILPGVTRDMVVAMSRRAGKEVVERPVQLDELQQADEIFLTGTTTEILGVVTIDGQQVADGHVETVTLAMHEMFKQWRHDWLAESGEA